MTTVRQDTPTHTFDADLVDSITRYEQGTLDIADTIQLFTHLCDTGTVWVLQGSWQRACINLMESGYLDRKTVQASWRRHKDAVTPW